MSTSTTEDAAGPAPEHLALLDDATLLQPPSGGGVASLADAVTRFRDRRTAVDGGVLRSLVVPDPVLQAFLDAARGSGSEAAPLPVTLAVSGGAGGLEPAAQWAARGTGVEVVGLAATLRDLDELAGAARRTVAAAEQAVAVLGEARVSVGLPFDGLGRPGWLAALDEVAMADHVVSFPTGGLAPVAPDLVVGALDAALDREVPVRLTGPAGHVPPRALLVAVRLVLDGELEAATELLSTRDTDLLARHEADLGSDALRRTRRWLVSVEALLP